MSKIIVKAIITRSYGPISLSFGLESEIEAASGGDIKREYNKLCDVIEGQISDYEQNRLPKLPAPPSKGIQADTKPQSKWWKAEYLMLNVSKGKKMYSIIPTGVARWAQYGVAVYFDSCPDVDPELFNMLLGNEVKVKLDPGMRVLIDETGKSAKVIGFKHKDHIGEE